MSVRNVCMCMHMCVCIVMVAAGNPCVSPCPQPLVAAKGKGTIVDITRHTTYVTQL